MNALKKLCWIEIIAKFNDILPNIYLGILGKIRWFGNCRLSKKKKKKNVGSLLQTSLEICGFLVRNV